LVGLEAENTRQSADARAYATAALMKGFGDIDQQKLDAIFGAGAKVITNAQVKSPGLTWESAQLFFVVREPFPSRSSSATMVAGYITRDRPLQITSLVPENGVIFSDGIENDFLPFNSGSIATIQPANRRGLLAVG
jgi:hypothetical protein